MVQAEIDEIAGAGDMRQAIGRLLHAHETKVFPVCLGQFAIRRRYGDLEKVAAARGVIGKPLAGRERARFDQTHQLTRRIEPADFIENIVAEMTKLKLDAPLLESVQMLEQVGFY